MVMGSNPIGPTKFILPKQILIMPVDKKKIDEIVYEMEIEGKSKKKYKGYKKGFSRSRYKK